MYAAVIREIGGPLEYAELPDPVARDGEVIVDITHATVNPLDIWISQGSPGAAASNLPWIPGNEGVGTVDGRMFVVRGAGHGVMRTGLFATKVSSPRSALVELPAGTDGAVAAAIGVAGVTASNCVSVYGECSAADRVLVLGATGGVGSLAVQLAKASGATVWAQTTSPAKVAGIEALGPDHVVVADADELVAAVTELRPTLVVDGLGGRFTTAAIDALELRGRIVLYGASAGDDVPLSSRGFYRKGLTLRGYTGLIEPPEAHAAIFSDLLARVADGGLTVPIELVPLADAGSAFRRILDRQVEGKLVLDVAGAGGAQ
jgi:NADPH2:quinone reductase